MSLSHHEDAIGRSAGTELRRYGQDVTAAWNQFFFTPRAVETLAVMRILSGAMLVYTHLIWAWHSDAFFGSQSWLPGDVQKTLAAEMGSWVWTPLFDLQSPATLIPFHLLTLAVMLCWTCGLATRPAGILSWLLTLAYMHRQTGALFGLDHANLIMVMYLMLAPCGSRYSLDAWRRRTGRTFGRFESWLSWPVDPSGGVARFTSAQIATRLLQLHLCVVYLFSGLAKLRGEAWINGWAAWFAIANDEYQSLDITWLMAWPWLIAAFTHGTVFLETFYCALIWPRLTRPWALAGVMMMHLGIAVVMGMPTFGLAMIMANLIFLPPDGVRWIVDGACSRLGRVWRRQRDETTHPILSTDASSGAGQGGQAPSNLEPQAVQIDRSH